MLELVEGFEKAKTRRTVRVVEDLDSLNKDRAKLLQAETSTKLHSSRRHGIR